MNITKIRTLVALGIAVGATVSAFPTGAHSSVAAAETESTVTWAVRPSDGEKADGRTSIEMELDPGESVQEYLEVTNLSRDVASFSISAADGYFTPQGRFNMLPSDRESTDAGTWIKLEYADVTVDAGQSLVVPFTVSVPANATPGDHPAGIAASVISVARSEDGATMGVESRVGFRVMTRVTGVLSPSVSISSVSALYDSSWDLLRPGAIDVTYVAENTGNTRLLVESTEVATSAFADSSAASVEPTELFPGDQRELSARIAEVWPFGLTTVVVELSPSVLPEGEASAPDPLRHEILVWTVPWLEILIVLGLALIGFAFLWGRRRQSAKVERLVAEARASFERGEAAARERTP